jgi:hypothetical protein
MKKSQQEKISHTGGGASRESKNERIGDGASVSQESQTC